MNPALFCILILGFAYYFAYHDCNIYMQNNMHNMQNNMQINSAGFIFCIFCILQYAEYAEYVKKYAAVCKTICKICTTICKTIVQGSYSAYCYMQNMLNMSMNMLNMLKNMLQYAKQYAKSALLLKRFANSSLVSKRFNEISTARLCSRASSRADAQSFSSIAEHRGDSGCWDRTAATAGTTALPSRPVLCNPSFPSRSEICRSSLQQVLCLDFITLDGPRFV